MRRSTRDLSSDVLYDIPNQQPSSVVTGFEVVPALTVSLHEFAHEGVS